jgi:predicted AlkP superfamily phosphohydrolase/phosphomutase
MANSTSIKVDRVWDTLSKAGLKVGLVGVPQTYPIREVNGVVVSCFLTPSTENQYTYPNELRTEIQELVGDYMLDVHDFRTEDKSWLLGKLYEMTRKRFAVTRHLMTTKAWDFFMLVEIGTDRLHHGFWKYMDETHRKFEKGNPFESCIKNYYEYLDTEIGKLLEIAGDDTVICVASDHGAKRMEGGICINEWLIQNGYLKLLSKPEGVAPIAQCNIDWSATTAWSEGGYYARVFMNVKGREADGIIEPEDYERVRSELSAKIAAIPDEKGQPLETRCYRPEDLYKTVNGIAPDLLVYFGDLFWRSVGSVGTGKLHTFDNDTGADDANHAQHGIFIMYDPRNPQNGRRVENMKLTDVAPTVLKLYDIQAPHPMVGASLI